MFSVLADKFIIYNNIYKYSFRVLDIPSTSYKQQKKHGDAIKSLSSKRHMQHMSLHLRSFHKKNLWMALLDSAATVTGITAVASVARVVGDNGDKDKQKYPSYKL